MADGNPFMRPDRLEALSKKAFELACMYEEGTEAHNFMGDVALSLVNAAGFLHAIDTLSARNAELELVASLIIKYADTAGEGRFAVGHYTQALELARALMKDKQDG